MDGPMTIQDDVTAGQKELQEIERLMVSLQTRMAGHDSPFDDDKCNRRFKRLRHRWMRIADDVKDWHGDVEECLSDGDPTVNFGGPK